MKIIKKSLLGIFILCLSAIAFILYQTRDTIQATPHNIDKILNELYDSSRMAGFAVSVIHHDQVIYQQGFGYADINKSAGYTIHTQQQIASISKTVIGVALLKAQELGFLNIDDPIHQYLPFNVKHPKFPEIDIRIIDLARHSSSLKYNETVIESLYLYKNPADSTMASFMKSYFQDSLYGSIPFLNARPGSQWEYSNIASALAAYIIEVATNSSFSAFTKRYIFDPLNMENAHWFESETDSFYYTRYYSLMEEQLQEVPSSGIVLCPCRDLICSIEDLSRYTKAIMNQDPRILSPRSYTILTQGSLAAPMSHMEEDEQAIFFSIDRNNFGIPYSLTGLDGGDYCIQTIMWFDQHTKMAYLFMGNTGISKANRIEHILIFQSLVSLGEHHLLEISSLRARIQHRIYNHWCRIAALF